MAKESEKEKKESKIQALLKVYFINGQHCDVKVVGSESYLKASVEELGKVGVWSAERGEFIYYPPHQIFRIRIKKL